MIHPETWAGLFRYTGEDLRDFPWPPRPRTSQRSRAHTAPLMLPPLAYVADNKSWPAATSRGLGSRCRRGHVTSFGRHERAHRQNCLHRRRVARGRNESKRGDDASYEGARSRGPPQSGEWPSRFCPWRGIYLPGYGEMDTLEILDLCREEIYTARIGSFCDIELPVFM